MRGAFRVALISMAAASPVAGQIDCQEGLRVVMPNDVGGTVQGCNGNSATVATDDGWFGLWPTAELAPAMPRAPSARRDPVVGPYRCVGAGAGAQVDLTFDPGDTYRDATGATGQVVPGPDGAFTLTEGPMDGYHGRQSFGMLVLTPQGGAALTCTLTR